MYHTTTTNQSNQHVHDIVPNYVTKSDYLPVGPIIESHSSQHQELIRRMEEERRRGRVFTQRPAEFDPSRYKSYCVSERIAFDQPMNEESFSRIQRRY